MAEHMAPLKRDINSGVSGACNDHVVRISDWINIAFDVSPRRVVLAFLLVVFGWMTLTGNWAPVEWYVRDQAAGYTEQLQRAVDGFSADLRRQAHILEDLHKPFPANALSHKAI
ncbi:hypothetical protein [Demequina sp.]|uniref:hypothetical protein n=1 Tax=Demequina sp. TaxID=2050685 RepID=UPI003D0FF925